MAEQELPVHLPEAPGARLRRREEHPVVVEEARVGAAPAVAVAGRTDASKN